MRIWRVCCCRILICLLLDEPTNHLDIKAVEWLESYLTQWEGAAIIVSHDRYFLDHACNALLEMAINGSEYYRGNYTTYLNEREIRWAHRFEIFESEKEKLLKEVEYIKKNISGQNTLQAKGKLKRLTRVVQAIEQVGIEAVNMNWSQLDIEDNAIAIQRGGSRAACAWTATSATHHA